MIRKTVILICVCVFLIPQISISGSNKAQVHESFMLFENEHDLQFDTFVQWVRKINTLKEVSVIRKELTAQLPFDGEELKEDTNTLLMKEVIGRFSIYKPCSYGALYSDVRLALNIISNLRRCSLSNCSDIEVMDKHGELVDYSSFLENFISSCKTHMNDIKAIRKVKLP
jgi:hypothetical protein